MKVTTCPYLSIQEDPETQLAFPSIRNCCRRARPIVPVNLSHQASHCLSSKFVNCPVPTHKLDSPLPVELRAELPARKGYLITVVISAFFVLGVIAAGLWKSGILTKSTISLPLATNENRQVNATSPNFLTYTESTPTLVPTVNQDIFPTPTITPSPSKTADFISTSTNSLAPTTTDSICTPPEGWVSYTVEPNDTLFQIGLDFGVTVAELQEANCLGLSEVIYTGQIIYVPNIPTRTPQRFTSRTPTRTATPTKRNEPHTKTPIPDSTNTPHLTTSPLPSDTPEQPTISIPSKTFTPPPVPTLTPPPLPTFTFTPPPS